MFHQFLLIVLLTQLRSSFPRPRPANFSCGLSQINYARRFTRLSAGWQMVVCSITRLTLKILPSRYAFVELADAETASKERLSIMGRLFAGMSVRVESRASQQAYSASTVDDIDFSRVVVTGLVPTVNQTDLKAIFPTAESVRLSMLKNFNLG